MSLAISKETQIAMPREIITVGVMTMGIQTIWEEAELCFFCFMFCCLLSYGSFKFFACDFIPSFVVVVIAFHTNAATTTTTAVGTTTLAASAAAVLQTRRQQQQQQQPISQPSSSSLRSY